MSIAFDSSALMAIVQKERGAEVASAELAHGRASALIFGETLSKLGLRGLSPTAEAARFKEAGLTVDPVTEEDAMTAASLFVLAGRGVSLADRFCLAHAMIRRLPVMTADRPWASLDLPVELRFIR